jgi:hypothetical protein
VGKLPHQPLELPGGLPTTGIRASKIHRMNTATAQDLRPPFRPQAAQQTQARKSWIRRGRRILPPRFCASQVVALTSRPRRNPADSGYTLFNCLTALLTPVVGVSRHERVLDDAEQARRASRSCLLHPERSAGGAGAPTTMRSGWIWFDGRIPSGRQGECIGTSCLLLRRFYNAPAAGSAKRAVLLCRCKMRNG